MPDITEIHKITDLHSGYITHPRWSPDGQFLAIPTQSGSVPILDMDTERIGQTLQSHSAEVTTIGWDHKAELIMTGSLDRSVGLWDPASGRRAPFDISGHVGPVHSAQWTDEGAYAITCSADRVRAYDGCCLLAGWTEDMEEGANKYTGFTEASCSCQTTLLLALAAQNGHLLVLVSLLSAALLDQVPIEQPIRSLAWSPGDDVLAVGTGETILIFRATQEGFILPAQPLVTDASNVHAVAFSGDGALLASHDAQGLKIWDVKSARLLAAVAEHTQPLNGRPRPGIAFNPSRPLVTAVTPDGNGVRILDVANLL